MDRFKSLSPLGHCFSDLPDYINSTALFFLCLFVIIFVNAEYCGPTLGTLIRQMALGHTWDSTWNSPGGSERHPAGEHRGNTSLS